MMLDDLLSRMESRANDTPDAPCNPPRVSAKPLQDKACTLDAPDTPQNVSAEDWALFSAWLFHFADRCDLQATFSPAVDHAAALAYYPDAVAAEPIPNRPQRVTTKAEAEEITALVQAIYAGETEEERAEALTIALSDPEGALLCYRMIAKDQEIALATSIQGTVQVGRCGEYFARPDKSDSYVSGLGNPDRKHDCEHWP